MIRGFGARAPRLVLAVALSLLPVGAIAVGAEAAAPPDGRTLGTASAGAEAAGRPWQVRDSIGVRYFFSDPTLSWWGDRTLAHSVAPDGRHFFIISTRGDLACDCRRFELAIYAVADVRSALARPAGRRAAIVPPLRVVRMRTSEQPGASPAGLRAPLEAIAWPRWETASTLLFRGTGDGDTVYGLYSYDIRADRLARLTPQGRYVGQFDVRNGTLIYGAFERRGRPRDANDYPIGLNGYPVQVLDGNDLSMLLDSSRDFRIGYFLQSPDGAERTLVPFTPVDRRGIAFAPQISPDGARAVFAMPVDRARFERLAANDPMLRQSDYDGLTDAERRRLSQFAVVDVATGQVTVPVDGLLGPQSPREFAAAYWLGNGRQLVMVNVLDPARRNPPDFGRSGAVLGYDTRTGSVSTAARAPSDTAILAGARLVQDGRAVELGYRNPDGTRSASLLSWGPQGFRQGIAPESGHLQSRRRAVLEGFELALDQGPNTPPTVVARAGSREIRLSAPDPAVRDIAWSGQNVFEWRDSHGHVARGLLSLPARPRSPGRWPLVIQFEPMKYGMTLYRPDGMASTGMAAQALAARGFAVLRLDSDAIEDHPPGRAGDPSLEGPLMVDRVESAIRALEAQGTIDPARVGLIGFSRTGFHVYYFITHSRFVPAAAITQDAGSQGYFQHVMQNAITDGEDGGVELGAAMRGGNFWERRDLWLRTAPGFNVDMVDTPTLFTYNGVLFALVEAPEPLAAFRMNDREAYFQLFPQGEHQLQRPRQRQASMQTTVDWFGFWLLGQESADPASRQDRDWRRLRAHRDARWTAARAAGRPFGPGWRQLSQQTAPAAAGETR